METRKVECISYDIHNYTMSKKYIETERRRQLAEIIKKSRNHFLTEIGNGKYKCECGGEFLMKYKSKHIKTQTHKDYMDCNYS